MATKRYERLLNNLKRVDSLLALHDILSNEAADSVAKDKEARSADILRAAVVFIHGSEEDYVRGVLSEWLVKKGEPSSIAVVPLAGEGKKRASKFTLQLLLSFADMGVNDLIQRSIDEYFSLVSFNSYSEIVSQLGKITIDLSTFKRQDQIEKLISRRHKIVHEVDIDSKSGHTNSINATTVRSWKEAVASMLEIVDKQIEAWGETEVLSGTDDSGETRQKQKMSRETPRLLRQPSIAER